MGFGVFRSKVEVDLTYHTYLQRKLFRFGCIIKNWENWENLAKHPGNCWINYDSIPFRVPLCWFPMWGTNSIDVFMVKVWMSDDQPLKSFEVRFVCFQDAKKHWQPKGYMAWESAKRPWTTEQVNKKTISQTTSKYSTLFSNQFSNNNLDIQRGAGWMMIGVPKNTILKIQTAPGLEDAGRETSYSHPLLIRLNFTIDNIDPPLCVVSDLFRCWEFFVPFPRECFFNQQKHTGQILHRWSISTYQPSIGD